MGEPKFANCSFGRRTILRSLEALIGFLATVRANLDEPGARDRRLEGITPRDPQGRAEESPANGSPKS